VKITSAERAGFERGQDDAPEHAEPPAAVEDGRFFQAGRQRQEELTQQEGAECAEDAWDVDCCSAGLVPGAWDGQVRVS
jgi:hypothetical protein